MCAIARKGRQERISVSYEFTFTWITLMSFALYIFGVLVVLSGAIYGAVLLNVPQQWIIVGSIIIAGIGILSAVASTRSRDKAQ